MIGLALTERIAELRKEIAEIQLATRSSSMSIPYLDREAMKAAAQGKTGGDYGRTQLPGRQESAPITGCGRFSPPHNHYQLLQHVYLLAISVFSNCYTTATCYKPQCLGVSLPDLCRPDETPGAYKRGAGRARGTR
jgi:hypothetical protein